MAIAITKYATDNGKSLETTRLGPTTDMAGKFVSSCIYKEVGDEVVIPFGGDNLETYNELRWTHDTKRVYFKKGSQIKNSELNVDQHGSLILENIQKNTAGEYTGIAYDANGGLIKTIVQKLCVRGHHATIANNGKEVDINSGKKNTKDESKKLFGVDMWLMLVILTGGGSFLILFIICLVCVCRSGRRNKRKAKVSHRSVTEVPSQQPYALHQQTQLFAVAISARTVESLSAQVTELTNQLQNRHPELPVMPQTRNYPKSWSAADFAVEFRTLAATCQEIAARPPSGQGLSVPARLGGVQPGGEMLDPCRDILDRSLIEDFLRSRQPSASGAPGGAPRGRGTVMSRV
ncbi:T-cell surface antigen CD2-like protein [Labeo rohita]|uniref:T-cell surface antigen CD2-like protein n=1 Tax=Labeo rohita TaxID=84645 RepID=A0A498NGL9_LABRO|nr:T-cell surface antigen CD2-like protein [Labeo rohita]